MPFTRLSLIPSSLLAACLLAATPCGLAGEQEKAPKTGTAPAGQVAPPSGGSLKEDKTPWRSLQPTDTVKATSAAEIRFADRQPFPPKGFAKGVIVTLGDDTGEPGTYRMAFKWQVNSQEFPLIECRLLEALENKLFTFGRQARHGKLTVEVKGTVTQYRDMNFLLLSDFHLPEGPGDGGGVPAGEGGIRNLP